MILGDLEYAGTQENNPQRGVFAGYEQYHPMGGMDRYDPPLLPIRKTGQAAARR